MLILRCTAGSSLGKLPLGPNSSLVRLEGLEPPVTPALAVQCQETKRPPVRSERD